METLKVALKTLAIGVLLGSIVGSGLGVAVYLVFGGTTDGTLLNAMVGFALVGAILSIFPAFVAFLYLFIKMRGGVKKAPPEI